MKTSKRIKKTRLSFRKKRGSQSRKLKQRQTFKRTNKMNYKQNGGLFGNNQNELVDLNRSIIAETVTVKSDGTNTTKQENTIENVFGTKLLQQTTMGIKRGSYVLKISIDIGKYNDYDTNEELYQNSNGIASSGITPPHMNELINALLSEVFQPTEELHIAEKLMGILTYQRALLTLQILEDEHSDSYNKQRFFDPRYCIPSKNLFQNKEPAKHCNIEICFEPLKPSGIQITSIKYTVIKRNEIACLTRKKGEGLFPVYMVEEQQNLKIIVPTTLTEEELKQKITTPKSESFYVSTVKKKETDDYGSDYYGFDKSKLDVKTQEESTRIMKEIKENNEQSRQKVSAEQTRRNNMTPEQRKAEDKARYDAEAAAAENDGWLSR